MTTDKDGFSDLVLEKDFDLVLEKTGLTRGEIVARFGGAVDISGSMGLAFANGSVGRCLEILSVPASRFDDDGNLEIIAYNDKAHPLPDVTSQNVKGYVTRNTIGGLHIGGWTLFAPILDAFMNRWFPKKGGFLGMGGKPDVSGGLAYLCLITDGVFEDENDRRRATEIIEAAQSLPVFIQIVGIGVDESTFAPWLKLPNVDWISADSVEELVKNPTALYEHLLSQKVCDFYKSHKK